MRKSLESMGCALAVALWFATASQADEPVRVFPVLDEFEALAQGKPDSKDPKKTNKEKDKDKKPPEVVLDRPIIFPEGRLDFEPRTLPRAPEMLGDLLPPGTTPGKGSTIPGVNGSGGGAPGAIGGHGVSFVLPGPRGFKVADNGSPRPQDRVFFGFQAYDDVYGAVNRSLGGNIGTASLYREYVGIEKTFLGGDASFEIRLPLNTLTVRGNEPPNGSHTALGDINMVFRYALYRADDLDNWFTVGLAVTAPTGPSTLGGIDAPSVSHSAVLQPYVQGFTAIDTPTNRNDVTLWYNDVALGYFLYRTPDDTRFLTAFAPSFEVHVATPLNYRGSIASGTGLAFDEVNLGVVANFEFRNRARLSAGIVTPVAGPNPFNVEGIVQLRFQF